MLGTIIIIILVATILYGLGRYNVRVPDLRKSTNTLGF